MYALRRTEILELWETWMTYKYMINSTRIDRMYMTNEWIDDKQMMNIDEHRQKYMADNVLVRETIAIMKHNSQKQVGKKRVY